MIYFIALIIFLLPSYLIRFSVFGIPTTLLEILIYGAAIITLFKIPRYKIQDTNKSQISNLKSRKILLPIILFMMAGIVSVIIAPDKREALGLFKAYIFDPILFFFVVLINLSKKKETLNFKSETLNKFKIQNSNIKIIINILILSGILVAIHAIWQKLIGNITSDGRVVGIFGYSPNYLALYLVPIAVILFGFEQKLLAGKELNWQNYQKILIYDVAFFLILIALWLTGSRAAIGAVVMGVISYLVISYWDKIIAKKINILFLCFSVLLFLGLSWQLIKPDWQASKDSGRISSSNNIRWEIWQTTIKDIIPKNNNWLWGVGLGNYQNYFTELTKDRVNFPEWIAPMALTPHNLFLTIWMNLGLLGLLVFLWLLYLFFKFSKNSILTSHVSLLTSVMITILVHGLVDTPYWKNDLAVMFWLILSLVLMEKQLLSQKKIHG